MLTGKNKTSAIVIAASGGFALIALSLKLYTLTMQRRGYAEVSALVKEGSDKVHILVFPKWNPALNVSTQCTKLETFLRIANVPYELHETDSFVSPTGRLPCLVHKGKLIVETNIIIMYLIKEFHLNIDDSLTKEDRALKVVVENVIEYTTKPSFYRTLILRGRNYIVPCYARAYGLPRIIAFISLTMEGKKVKSVPDTSSVDHLTEDQLDNEFLRDIESIECLIGKKLFVFGRKPCSLDCTLYALLAPIIVMEGMAAVSKAFAYIAQSSVLNEYVDRMTRLAFPECSDKTKLFRP